MDHIDVTEYLEAKRDMEKLRKSISPLASVLLVADYSHPELDLAISKLPYLAIERIDTRFNIVFQLLQNQKNKFYRPRDDWFTQRESGYDETYCDFKEVMKILGKKKSSVESLIANKNITPVSRPGKKRSFLRAKILDYAQGIR